MLILSPHEPQALVFNVVFLRHALPHQQLKVFGTNRKTVVILTFLDFTKALHLVNDMLHCTEVLLTRVQDDDTDIGYPVVWQCLISLYHTLLYQPYKLYIHVLNRRIEVIFTFLDFTKALYLVNDMLVTEKVA